MRRTVVPFIIDKHRNITGEVLVHKVGVGANRWGWWVTGPRRDRPQKLVRIDPLSHVPRRHNNDRKPADF